MAEARARETRRHKAEELGEGESSPAFGSEKAESDKEAGEEEEDEEWIAVDREKAAWTLLINRLQDCLAIAVMFSLQKPMTTTTTASTTTTAPVVVIKTALKKTTSSTTTTTDETREAEGGGDDDVVEGLSVNGLLKAGRGGIPELVARWAARRGVTLDQLHLLQDVDRRERSTRRWLLLLW